MNMIWKQAVRLSLKKSITSAKLIINNDRELNAQKREQLIVVHSCLISERRSDTSSIEIFRRRIQSYRAREDDER